MALIVGADNSIVFSGASSSTNLMVPSWLFTLWTSIGRRRSRTHLPSIYRLSRVHSQTGNFRLPPVALIPEKDAPMTEPIAPVAPITGSSPAMTIVMVLPQKLKQEGDV
jgi:hypothetical protein